MLWVDWQSIYQDDKEEKMKGVRSLIKYATLSDYMLVPSEEEELGYFHVPEQIPGYGERGWCRCEYFIFALAAEMRGIEAQYIPRFGSTLSSSNKAHVPGTGVQLYAIQRDGALNQYPEIKVFDANAMPSGGKLSNPADKACVQALEDQMIDAYGKGMVESKCKAGAGGKVDLSGKMLRPVHMAALCEAVVKYGVKELNLDGNQLGDEGVKALAPAVAASDSLVELHLCYNQLGDEGTKALATAVAKSSSLVKLHLSYNQIGDEGAKAVAKAIPSCGSLKYLFIHTLGNNIGNNGKFELTIAADGRRNKGFELY